MLKDLTFSFPGRASLIDNVSLSLNSGAICALMGANGAGKTTLFNILTGFIRPDSGEIIFGGEDITHLAPYKINRKGIGRFFSQSALTAGVVTIALAVAASASAQLTPESARAFFKQHCVSGNETSVDFSYTGVQIATEYGTRYVQGEVRWIGYNSNWYPLYPDVKYKGSPVFFVYMRNRTLLLIEDGSSGKILAFYDSIPFPFCTGRVISSPTPSEAETFVRSFLVHGSSRYTFPYSISDSSVNVQGESLSGKLTTDCECPNAIMLTLTGGNIWWWQIAVRLDATSNQFVSHTRLVPQRSAFNYSLGDITLP